MTPPTVTQEARLSRTPSCVATSTVEIKKNEEGPVAQFVPAAELAGLDMAFDHEDILLDAMKS